MWELTRTSRPWRVCYTKPQRLITAYFRITDGFDDDWASWYADWLTKLSELPELRGRTPVRSELGWMLVQLDKDYVATQTGGPWETYYATRLLDHFAS